MSRTVDRNHQLLRAGTLNAIEHNETRIVELTRRIYHHPELSYQEHLAAGWCREVLSDTGFKVEDVAGVPTGFVATVSGEGPGPCVGFLGEYDALPDLGHACGHHLIAGSAVGAGLALAAMRHHFGGTVKVFGCPAEEIGRGKVDMIAAGVFESVDAALTFHAHDITGVMKSCTGRRYFELSFRGRPAHASADPWVGASALDGVLLTLQAVNALRQFVRDGVRIHSIVTAGGEAVNVVPEIATLRMAVRSTEPTELNRVFERVLDCARAGALASDTELTVEHGPEALPGRLNEPLAAIVRANLVALGEDVVEDWVTMSSSDFGNVSWEVPAVLVSVATWPAGTAFHTHDAAEAAGRDAAFSAMLVGARAMALTAVDVLVNRPDLD